MRRSTPVALRNRMELSDWYRLFTWLCLAANAALVGLVVARLVGGRLWESVSAQLAESRIGLAALVTTVATLGSLYLSEGGHLTPCRLCWFQRIFMYSTAVVLLIAAARRDSHITPYAVALLSIGSVISIYHRAIEINPNLEGVGGSCDPLNPCSAPPMPIEFGYISIPVMALSASLLAIALLVLLRDRALTD